VRASMRELERYRANSDGVAEDIRELLKKQLREAFAEGRRVLLIGHSMGSIIAYDALWELSRRERLAGRVDLFLTLGSPLGLHYIQERLLGYERDVPGRYPGNIARWVNIAAHGDLVAVDSTVADDFAPMVGLGLTASIEDVGGVFNYFRNERGLNVHRSYGYFVNATVGAEIAAWWRGEPAGVDAASGST
jgi:pimeloyl-ACP methyl ester carboxylesterase